MKRLLVPLLSGFVGLLLLAYGAVTLDRLQVERYREQQRAHTQAVVRDLRARIEGALNVRLNLAVSLSALVHVWPNVDGDRFTAYAQDISAGITGVRGLQLAPGGTVAFTFPEDGGGEVKGLNLLSAPRIRESALQSMRENRFLLTGPYELKQGGRVVAGRLPIFLPNADYVPWGKFWGFATVLVDLDTLLRVAGVDAVNLPIDVAVGGRDGWAGEGEIFLGDPALFDQDVGVGTDIVIPNGAWRIAGRPKGGWATSWPGREWLVVMALLMAGLVILAVRLRLRADWAVVETLPPDMSLAFAVPPPRGEAETLSPSPEDSLNFSVLQRPAEPLSPPSAAASDAAAVPPPSEPAAMDFDAEKVLRGVGRQLHKRLGRRDVQWSVEVDEQTPPTLNGDRARLEAILVDLMATAVSLGEAHGDVRLGARVHARDGEDVDMEFIVAGTTAAGQGLETACRLPCRQVGPHANRIRNTAADGAKSFSREALPNLLSALPPPPEAEAPVRPTPPKPLFRSEPAPPPPPPPAAAAVMPEIYGVETADGLKRAGGDVAQYRARLQQFTVQHGHADRVIRFAVETGDTATALSAARSLADAAAELGIPYLAESAVSLAAGLEGGGNVSAVSLFAITLQDQVSAITEALEEETNEDVHNSDNVVPFRL